MATAIAQPKGDGKRNKERSPAFPFIGLRAAIERAKEFYKQEKRNAAPVSVAVEHWGYGQKSSTGTQTVAALKYFGLLKDIGAGGQRKLQLTDLGLRIVMDERAVSPERDELVKKAALLPKAYVQLWNQWGTSLPSEESVKHHLRVDLKFSDSTVDLLVRGYKDTIAFAKVTESDKVGAEVEDNDGQGGAYVPKVGDYVQWEAGGVLKFREPKRVTGLSSDGGFAFVEGSRSGLPVAELTKELRPANTELQLAQARSPANPHQSPKTSMQEMIVPLSEGRAVFQWPTSLTQEDILDLTDSLKILGRKIARSTNKEEKEPAE